MTVSLTTGLAVAGLLAGTTAPALHPNENPAVTTVAAAGYRGDLVSATHLKTFSPAQVDAYVEDHGFARPHSRYPTALYRVVYRTITPAGRPTTASGLVALPRSADRRLRLTSYTHGTTSNRDDVASVSEDDTSRAVALMFGGAGMAVAAPDYLGLGLGPGHHPYVHLASETSASVDMLLATRSFAAGRGVRLDRDVLVSGFSQGGRVAVNLGKALQLGRVPGFGLGAVAAVAGPYDLERVELPAAFDGRVDPRAAAFYLGYLVTAWDRLIGLYDDPAQAFKPPYDTTVEALFDGRHSFDEIIAGLPATPADLFQPAFVQRLLHPTGSYGRLVRAGDASCEGWTPKAPVRLYYGGTDREVVPGNTASCLRSFGRSKVRAIEVGPVGHFESWFASYPGILAWFGSLG
jgi:hypothetical protein